MSDRDFTVARLLALLSAPLWLAVTSAAHGTEQKIDCPPTLETGHDKVPPPGWRLVMLAGAHLNGQPARLTTAGMLHGPPEESGYLAPAESNGRKQGNRSNWKQQWMFDQPHWYQTFAYCGYGGGRGPLQLFKPIAEDATECTLTSSTKDGVVERMAFVCR